MTATETYVTGYVNINGYDLMGPTRLTLTRGNGKVMLATRARIVQTYRYGDMDARSHAVVFALTHRRFVVGYALDDDGSLFRGELMSGIDGDEADHFARQIAEHWLETDIEDEAEAYEDDFSDLTDEVEDELDAADED
jgi:hypothetical protein